MDRQLIEITKIYMAQGIYDQHVLFDLVSSHGVRKHYATIRRAIHDAKVQMHGN